MSSGVDETFATEVNDGLSGAQKRLSSKWFYDAIGDDLFVQIMNMPEYYLTDCEFEIFEKQTTQIIETLGVGNSGFDIYELGAGDGTKTIQLLKGLGGLDFTYRPIDISHHAIENLEKRIAKELPDVRVSGFQGEYFEVLSKISSDLPKVILFLGSNIGNLLDDQANAFLKKLSHIMNQGDALILGVDLKKSIDIVLPAYNDAQGITAAFNLNLLDRINKELNGNFDRDSFVHAPIYDEEMGWAKSYIESTKNQSVTIGKLNKSFDFEVGEKIFMEISRKYDDQTIDAITENTNLRIRDKFFDQRKYFCDVVFVKE